MGENTFFTLAYRGEKKIHLGFEVEVRVENNNRGENLRLRDRVQKYGGGK